MSNTTTRKRSRHTAHKIKRKLRDLLARITKILSITFTWLTYKAYGGGKLPSNDFR